MAILALNSDRYFELLYAIPWLGAVVVPINIRLATPEIRYILEDSGARVLFYTCGTTGKPKGVMLSHNNRVWNAMNVIAGMYYDQDMTHIHAGPMFHLADSGATFGVTTCGKRSSRRS